MMADYNIFQDGWNERNSYIFGLIMSDGCLRKEGRNKNRYVISITLNDMDLINTLHEYMCIGNKVYLNGERNYMLKYRNQDGIKFLMNYGLTERKSLTMQLPNIPDEFFGSFLRGYFDGDGSLILKNTKYNLYGQVSFTSGSCDFLAALKDKLYSIYGIDSQIYEDGRSSNKSQYLRITRRSSIEVLESVMYSDCSICLDRKRQRFVTLKNNPLKYNIS